MLRYECAACSSWRCYLPLTAPHIPREALADLVFRLLAILSKVQRSREAASINRKKAKYRRQGSPVERVLEILQRLKLVLVRPIDRENLTFIMDIIVSDQLYTVNVSAEQKEVSKEMATFLLEGGAVAGPARSTRRSSKPDARGRKVRMEGDDDERLMSEEDEARLRAEAGGGQRHSIGRRPSCFPVAATVDQGIAWVEKLLYSDDVFSCMQKVHDWDFDVFELDRASNRHPIVMLVMQLVGVHNLDDQLSLNVPNLVRFLGKLEQGYKDVPFHTYVHAADVVHGTAYFLMREAVAKHLSPLDIYCMILAAAMHDYEHPGCDENTHP